MNIKHIFDSDRNENVVVHYCKLIQQNLLFITNNKIVNYAQFIGI